MDWQITQTNQNKLGGFPKVDISKANLNPEMEFIPYNSFDFDKAKVLDNQFEIDGTALQSLLEAKEKIEAEQEIETIEVPDGMSVYGSWVDPEKWEEINQGINPLLREVSEATPITEENFEVMKEKLDLPSDFLEKYKDYDISFVTYEDGTTTIRYTDKKTGQIVADDECGFDDEGNIKTKQRKSYSYDDEGNVRVDVLESWCKQDDGRWFSPLEWPKSFYYSSDGTRCEVYSGKENDFVNSKLYGPYNPFK